MDKELREDQAADSSSWLDTQVLRQQSQWLHTTLSDLDTKINAILSIIVQDDGDSFAKRAEMYYQKRPELIEMVEDLHKSYRSLAEKYEQLKSESNHDPHHHPRLLSSTKPGANHDQFVTDDSSSSTDDYSSTNNSMIKKVDCGEGSNNFDDNNEVEIVNGNVGNGNSQGEKEKAWNELVEDNLNHQAELIRRNDEKREIIRDLYSKLEKQNKAVKKKQSQLSRLKGLLLGRFVK